MFYLSNSIQVSLVDSFVASGGIPTSGLGVRDMGIVIGTRLDFSFGENRPWNEVVASWIL
jgi:hypothetical protein